MNTVDVYGGQKHQREIAEKVVWRMIYELMPRMRTLDINVEIKKLKGDAYGWCLMADEKGREFELEISSQLPLRDFVSTICHEMIHVKQYAYKEMDGEIMHGETLRWKKGKVKKGTSYYDLPWEKEAYRLQDKYADLIWDSNIL